MENNANLYNNFQKLVHNHNKLMDSFSNGRSLSKCLEEEVYIGKYVTLNEPIQWKYDEFNIFDSFDEYKEFTEEHNPELVESLEHIEDYIHRLEEIIYYLEEVSNTNIENIKIKNVYFSSILEVEKEIGKYKKVSEFQKENPRLCDRLYTYKKGLGEEWYKKYTSHFEERNSWTQSEIEKEIKKYNSPIEVQNSDYSLYNALQRYKRKLGDKWYNNVISHFIDGKIKKWPLDKVISSMKEYNYLEEIRINEAGLYNAIKRYQKELGKDWYDKASSHFTLKGKLKWTPEIIKEEVKKYTTLAKLSKDNQSLYNAIQRYRKKLGEDWYNEITGNLKIRTSWTPDLVKKEALKYNSASEFNKGNGSAYNNLMKFKKECGEEWYNEVTEHFTIGTNLIWTPDLVKKEAKKYNSPTDFFKNNQSAYGALNKYRYEIGEDWYNNVTSHFVSGINEIEKEYIETVFIPRLVLLLESLDMKYELDQEVIIPKRDNNLGRVDILLRLIDYDTLMTIEIKHDENRWSEAHIEKQVAKYNRAFRERKGFEGTYLVSPEGKYGFSEKEFFDIITFLHEEGKLATPHSLDWYQKRRK